MKPVEFSGVNVVFAKDQPEYMPLPAMKIPNDPQGLIITKWQLSPEELERVKETGTIVNVQPQSDGKFFIEWVKNNKDGTPYKRISLMNSIEVEEIKKA